MNRLIIIFSIILIFWNGVYSQEDDSTSFVHVINSLLGRNQPKLGFMSQFAAEVKDNGKNTTSEFTIRNLRMYFTGSAGENFSYYFQGNLNGTFSLLDLKLMYKLDDHFRIDAGRLKTPYSVEYLRNDARISFTSRSTVASTIGPFRQYGVQLNGSFIEKKIQFTAGAFNGDNSVKKNISLFVGRALFTPIKKDDNDHAIQLEISGSMAYTKQEDDFTSLPFYDKNHLLLGGYTRFTFEDYWLESEYLNSNSDNLKTREGFFIDLGRKFCTNWELIGRFDWFAKYPQRMYQISRKYIGGINYYPFKEIKIQFNYERDQTNKTNAAYLNFQYAVNFE
jgi:phosphate-selective porin